jgi:shikimate kinase
MKIVLIGFMGTGKSSVAKALKKKLRINMVEMDNLIIKKSGRKTVKEIFNKDGEKHFRALEAEICQSLKDQDNLIISTGGGIIGNKTNINNLNNKGQIFYLKTSFSTIEKRLKNDRTRPLFKNKERARKLFNIRQNLYEKFADKTIITDDKTINEVVNYLVNLL